MLKMLGQSTVKGLSQGQRQAGRGKVEWQNAQMGRKKGTTVLAGMHRRAEAGQASFLCAPSSMLTLVHCPGSLTFMPTLSLQPNMRSCNNACWSTGEVSVKVQPEVVAVWAAVVAERLAGEGQRGKTRDVVGGEGAVRARRYSRR